MRTEMHPVFAGKSWAQVRQAARRVKATPSFGKVNVNFYYVRGQSWSPTPSSTHLFPFRTDSSKGAIAPLAGNLYLGAKRLPDSALEQLGLVAVRDDQGNKVSFPYLCGRQRRVLMTAARPPIHFRDGAVSFLSYAQEFKGFGSQYAGRVVYYNPDGSLPLNPGETPLGEKFSDVATFVGNLSLVGEWGIFLDQPHQPPPSTPDPVGGMTKVDTKAIKQDSLLIQHGAVMGCLSLSGIRLLKQGATGGELFGLWRLAGQDSRRLTMFSSPHSYERYIKETYGRGFVQGRETHLMLLARNLGQNMRAALRCGLTVKPRKIQGNFYPPNTMDNFTPRGEMLDSTQLTPARSIDDSTYLLSTWLADFLLVAGRSGLTPADYLFQPKFIGPLFDSFLGRPVAVPALLFSRLRDFSWEGQIQLLGGFCLDLWKSFAA